jgi:sarcosine oxidase
MADGIDGVKVATEQTEHATTADSVDRVVTDAETALTFEAHIRGRLRGVTSRSVHEATCLYTSTADHRFVVDRHPQ